MITLLLTSAAFGLELGSSQTIGVIATPTGSLPSLDLRTENLLFQIHALEFVSGLANELLLLGGDLYFGKFSRPMGQTWKGIVQPGVGVSVLGDPFVLYVLAEARLGGEMTTSGARLGVSVVPELGLLTGDPDPELVVGGGVQFSAWFGAGK